MIYHNGYIDNAALSKGLPSSLMSVQRYYFPAGYRCMPMNRCPLFIDWHTTPLIHRHWHHFVYLHAASFISQQLFGLLLARAWPTNIGFCSIYCYAALRRCHHHVIVIRKTTAVTNINTRMYSFLSISLLYYIFITINFQSVLEVFYYRSNGRAAVFWSILQTMIFL